MRCPNCGEDQAVTARFCAGCGHPLADRSQGESPADSQPTRSRGWRRPSSSVEERRPKRDDRRAVTVRPQPSHSASGTLCRVCGTIVPPMRRTCVTCGTPPGMVVAAEDPFASTYVFPGAATPDTATSAPFGRSGAETNGAGWNWGAAFLTCFWAAAHGLWWYVVAQALIVGALLLIALIPNTNVSSLLGGALLGLELIAWLPLRLYFGRRGTELAYRSRRFESSAQCLQVQDLWRPFGIGAGVVEIAILAGGVLLLALGGIGAAR